MISRPEWDARVFLGHLIQAIKKLSQNPWGSRNRGTIETGTYFAPLTPTLSQWEREPLVGVLPFPRPLGEGRRVRVFVLRCHPI